MTQLRSLPELSRLLLATVQPPESHPRGGDGSCDVYAYVVHHPDGAVLVDTGVGVGNVWIDRLYSPAVVDVVDALGAAGIDERDVVAVVNTHLHFDHCGQNHRFSGRPVYVQHAELDAARDPVFTVAEWAMIPPADLRIVDGDLLVADGLRLMATPGHTPGHQSVVLESDEGRLVIAGQCAYCCGEFATGDVPVSDMHDAGWHETGRGSLARLRALEPVAVYFSHDGTTLRRALR
jgi:N-acyl homoserine lactone hydrolase